MPPQVESRKQAGSEAIMMHGLQKDQLGDVISGSCRERRRGLASHGECA